MRRLIVRGTTLAEMIVYFALTGFVFSGIYSIFSAGMKYYRTTQGIIKLQQEAQMAPYRMARELMESNLSGIRFYPNSLSYYDVPRGVVFISARDPANGDAIDISSTTGRPRWCKYVCYYEEHTEQYHMLCRKEYKDPSINPNSKPVPCAYDTQWFASNKNLKKRIIARNLNHRHDANTGFEIYSGDPESGTKELNSPFNPICIRCNFLEMTDKEDNVMNITVLVSTRN
jgi:hypothetical protein